MAALSLENYQSANDTLRPDFLLHRFPQDMHWSREVSYPSWANGPRIYDVPSPTCHTPLPLPLPLFSSPSSLFSLSWKSFAEHSPPHLSQEEMGCWNPVQVKIDRDQPSCVIRVHISNLYPANWGGWQTKKAQEWDHILNESQAIAPRVLSYLKKETFPLLHTSFSRAIEEGWMSSFPKTPPTVLEDAYAHVKTLLESRLSFLDSPQVFRLKGAWAEVKIHYSGEIRRPPIVRYISCVVRKNCSKGEPFICNAFDNLYKSNSRSLSGQHLYHCAPGVMCRFHLISDRD